MLFQSPHTLPYTNCHDNNANKCEEVFMDQMPFQMSNRQQQSTDGNNQYDNKDYDSMMKIATSQSFISMNDWRDV